MITPRAKEREPYDENRDYRVDHSVRDRDFYDKRKERKPTKHGDKFIPRRRGPAKITWPLAPKKALILLTGRTPFSRALVAYEHFFNVRCAALRKPHWSSDLIRKTFLDEPWTEDFFRDSAKEYLLYPRKGFNAAKQKERISKVFRKLGLK